MNHQRIRLAFNTRRKGGTVDSLTGVMARLIRGYPADIEVCLLNNQAVEDISDIETLTLRCVPNAAITGSASFVKVLAAVDINESMTAQQWTTETAQQARFSLTAADTALAMGGKTELDFRFLVSAINDDGEEIPWGFAVVTVVEAGRNATTAPEDPEDYETAEVADAKYQKAKAGFFWAPNVDGTGTLTGQTTPWRVVIDDSGNPHLQPGTPEAVVS